MAKRKAKPLIAKGWLYWHKGCSKHYTPSVREALDAKSRGMIVHRVEIRSVPEIE